MFTSVTRRPPAVSRLLLLATILVLASCGGDEEIAGGAGDLPGPVPEDVRFREPPALPVMRSLPSPQDLVGSPGPDARRIAHRQRMLDHLQRASSVAS